MEREIDYFKMITGMLIPTSGEIYFDGHKWTRHDLHSIGALIESLRCMKI